MDDSSSIYIKRMLACALELVCGKTIRYVDDEEVTVLQLKMQLDAELVHALSSLQTDKDETLMSAYLLLRSAITCAAINDIDQQNTTFNECMKKAEDLFREAVNFIDKCTAVRIKLICILSLNSFFSGSCNTESVIAECRNTLILLVTQPTVKTALKYEFRKKWFSKMSKADRMVIFTEISDIIHYISNNVVELNIPLKEKKMNEIQLSTIAHSTISNSSGQFAVMCARECLFSGSWEGVIKIWDTKTLTEVGTLRGHTSCVFGMVVGNNRLYSSSFDGIIKIWDLTTLKEVGALVGHTNCVPSLLYRNGRVISASFDKTIKIWDAATLTEITTLIGHTNSVHSLVSQNDKLYSASDDKIIKVWDMTRLTEIARLVGHTDGVHILLIVGHCLYSGSSDQTIKVWNTTTHEVLASLWGHAGIINCLGYSNGKLYSGSNDNTIKVWNTTSHTLIETITSHSSWVNGIECSHGKLYSVSSDKTIQIRFA